MYIYIHTYVSYGFIELADYHKRAFTRNNVNYEVITGLLKTFERKGNNRSIFHNLVRKAYLTKKNNVINTN